MKAELRAAHDEHALATVADLERDASARAPTEGPWWDAARIYAAGLQGDHPAEWSPVTVRNALGRLERRDELHAVPGSHGVPRRWRIPPAEIAIVDGWRVHPFCAYPRGHAITGSCVKCGRVPDHDVHGAAA